MAGRFCEKCGGIVRRRIANVSIDTIRREAAILRVEVSETCNNQCEMRIYSVYRAIQLD